MPSRTARGSDSIGRFDPPGLVPWIVVAVSVLLTLVAFHSARQTMAESARLRFEARVTETATAIRDRMLDYEQILRGATALFAASVSVDRAEWRKYVQALDVDRRHPGIQGIGFSLYVPAAQIDTHVAAVRAEGFSDYSVWPPGRREEYTSIIYLEPFAGRNLRAFGYDMMSEPVRRAAMERARDSGQAALSGRVKLVQETDQDVQVGTLIYLPVYRDGQPHETQAQRRAALIGFAYAPFRMDDLVRGILGAQLRDLDLSAYDGSISSPDQLLYRHRSAGARAPADDLPIHAKQVDLEVAGRHWSLDFTSTPLFEEAAESHLPWAILAGGLTISMLLFGITSSLAARARALALANGMTGALRESQARTSAIIESTLDGIITIDERGAILSANRAAEGIFGYQASGLAGRNIGMLAPQRERAAHSEGMRRYLAGGAPEAIGTRRQVTGLRRDGSEFPLELAVTEMRADGQRQFIGVVRDISERLSAELALLEREQRFRTLAALAPVGIFEADANGSYTYVNDRWCELAGMARQAATGDGWLAALHPDDAQRLAAQWRDAVRAGSRCDAEYRFVSKAGKMRWIAARVEPVRDDAGGMLHFIGVADDISARKDAEVAREQARQAEARAANLGRILERTSNEIYVFDAATKRFLHVNEHACRNVRHSLEEMLQMTPLDVLRGYTVDRFSAMLEPLLHGGLDSLSFEAEHWRKDGSTYPVEVRVQLLEYEERPAFVAIINDISERREAQQSLHEANALRQAILDCAAFSIIATDLNGMIRSINPAGERMLWYAQDEIVGTPILALLNSGDQLNSRASVLSEELGEPVGPGLEALVAKARRGLTDESEWIYVRKDGARIPVQMALTALRDMQGEVRGFLVMAYDITERKRNEDYVRHLALHDALTGLPNRILLQDRMVGAVERAKREHTRVALLFIDLDRFKTINDSLGHHVGDELIKAIAARLKNCVRGSDTVARMGGDEFVVVLPDLRGDDSPVPVIEKILAAVAAPTHVGAHELLVTSSIGVGICPDHGSDVATLMKNADMAMYRAKESGRNNFKLFDPDMNRAAVRRLALENDLRRALERDELVLYYQPQVDCRTQRMVGVEGLLRWRHPRLGLVLPGEFIVLAEETGLIVPIGQWVLRSACASASRWERETGERLRVAVNLSPRQMFAPHDLVECVRCAIHETGVAPDCLEMEITESLLLRSTEETRDALTRLHGLGVRLAIDDFGSGYSNLAYLKRFPIHKLKIDQSFVRDLPADADDAAIAGTIIAMAHALKMRVVAEGVETAEQQAFLLSRDCDEAQGYYFGRPVALEELRALCRSSATDACGGAV